MASLISRKTGLRRPLFREINVTPFVDVMLVLLIIFMATAPLLRQGLNLSVPETDPVPSKISPDPFVLKIKKNRKIFIGSANIPMRDVSKRLRAIFKARADQEIYLEADKSVPYETVAQTLAKIQAAGISNIYLVTISQ